MGRSAASAEQLVEQLRPYIGDERVLSAIADVPRDLFVPARLADLAWENTALPIGSGQTISQPIVVARMCQLLELRGEEKVLDVGTGSGYHAAVLARLAREVWSIERKEVLARSGGRNLAAAGIENVPPGRGRRLARAIPSKRRSTGSTSPRPRTKSRRRSRSSSRRRTAGSGSDRAGGSSG